MNLKELKGIDLLEKFQEAFLKFKMIWRNAKLREQLDLLGPAQKDTQEAEEEVLRRLDLLDSLLAGDSEGEFGHLTHDQLFEKFKEQLVITVAYRNPVYAAAKEKRDLARIEVVKLQAEIMRRMAKANMLAL